MVESSSSMQRNYQAQDESPKDNTRSDTYKDQDSDDSNGDEQMYQD